MNIVKVMLLCVALVFAQQTLRGFAYNPYGTLGAAPTIEDILQKPSDIYRQKFIYVSPEPGSGYSAFDLADGSALLGFDQSLMLGFAKSFYGLFLNVSPYKRCDRNSDGNYECSSNQNIGLNFSVPFGGSIIYAHTGYATRSDYYDENTVRYKQAADRETYIGITGGNNLVWDLRFNFDRYKTSYSGYTYEEYNFTPVKFKFSDYQTNIVFLFNFGYKVLQNDRLKFIVGLNNELSWESNSYYYAIDLFEYYLRGKISPNFLGEIALTKHLLAFVGASYNIVSYLNWTAIEEDDTNMDTFNLDKYEPGAYVGLRCEYKNWAVETRLQSDAVGRFLDGKTPFIKLGAFFFFQ
ncbi:MAG: hypothetical protein LBC75_13165 [Fibromonadaceae bacterium]|nr:hypothetical protein [Fibromonadaceae bacterium]